MEGSSFFSGVNFVDTFALLLSLGALLYSINAERFVKKLQRPKVSVVLTKVQGQKSIAFDCKNTGNHPASNFKARLFLVNKKCTKDLGNTKWAGWANQIEPIGDKIILTFDEKVIQDVLKKNEDFHFILLTGYKDPLSHKKFKEEYWSTYSNKEGVVVHSTVRDQDRIKNLQITYHDS
tara:strand:+ start:543 stop:1076 length:534 start_codon:yes stop_codon:yes gene_type:complete